jgi:hypothetical protein
VTACSSPSPSFDAGHSDGPIVHPADASPDATADATPDATPDASTATKWARAYGTPDTDFIIQIAVGPDRSVVGIIYDIGSTVATDEVVKLDEHGNPVWTHAMPAAAGALAIAVDGADDIYVSGEFSGIIDIDGHVVIAPTPDYAEFLAKLDGGTGVAEWAVLLANHSLFQGQDIAVSADGSTIAVAGGVDGINPVNLGGDDLVSNGYGDVVVAVFDGAGVHRWSRSFGAEGSDYPRQIVFSSTGDVIVCGTYGGQPDFGGGPLPEYGDGDSFMASYAGADGAHLWSYGFGVAGHFDYLQGLAVDGDALYAVADFSVLTQFGGPTVIASGGYASLLLRYDAATGAFVWQNPLGGEGNVFMTGLGVAGGQIVFGGQFTGSIDVGSTHLTSNGSADLVWGRADPATGAFLSAGSDGGTGGEHVYDFGTNGADVWFAGSFNGAAHTLFGSFLATTQGEDAFIGRTQL